MIPPAPPVQQNTLVECKVGMSVEIASIEKANRKKKTQPWLEYRAALWNDVGKLPKFHYY